MNEGIEGSGHPVTIVPRVGAPSDGLESADGDGAGFAEWLRMAMGARGFTLAELARRTGVSRSAAAAWLAGRTFPSMESLAAIAVALELDASTVLAAAGIHIVDDDRTARIAELLGKVDRVRLTPDRISGLGGLLDAWIAADRPGSGSPVDEPRIGSLDYVVRFVPRDGRPPIEIERTATFEDGHERLLSNATALSERGELGNVRLVMAKGARIFGERIVSQAEVRPRSPDSPTPGTGPPGQPVLAEFSHADTQTRVFAAEHLVSASHHRFVEETYVASMHPLAASDNDEQVYTLAEAARLKGVSYHTVSRAVRQGKLPHHRLGRMAFITSANLAAWRPMVERAPKKYARRTPDPAATPAMLDLASGDRVLLAQRFSILSEVIHAAAADKPIGDVLDLLARRFGEALDLDRVSVWELDGQTGAVRRLAFFGHPRGVSPADATPGEADAVRHLAAVESAGIVDGSGFVQPSGSLARMSAVVAAPLRVGRRTLGLIIGDCAGTPFHLNPDQLAFAQALANQAALSMEVSEAHDRVETVPVP